jgi:hypothetical protein
MGSFKLAYLSIFEGTVENTEWEYGEPKDESLSTGLIIGNGNINASADYSSLVRHNGVQTSILS